jgi:hypothetical protein
MDHRFRPRKIRSCCSQLIENEYDHDYDKCEGPDFAKASSGRLSSRTTKRCYPGQGIVPKTPWLSTVRERPIGVSRIRVASAADTTLPRTGAVNRTGAEVDARQCQRDRSPNQFYERNGRQQNLPLVETCVRRGTTRVGLNTAGPSRPPFYFMELYLLLCVIAKEPRRA